MDLVQALMLIFFLWLFIVVVNSGVTVHHKYKIKQIENQVRDIKNELKESCHKHKLIDSHLSNIDTYLNALERSEMKREQELSEKNDQQHKIINVLYQAVLDDGIKELMQEKKAHMEDIEKLDEMLSVFLKGKGEENDKV